MGLLTRKTAVVQIDEENSITVRSLDNSDVSVLQTQYTHYDAEHGAWTDWSAVGSGMARRAIVSWDGPDFEGQEATPQNISKLPGWVIGLLLPVVRDLSAKSQSEF